MEMYLNADVIKFCTCVFINCLNTDSKMHAVCLIIQRTDRLYISMYICAILCLCPGLWWTCMDSLLSCINQKHCSMIYSAARPLSNPSPHPITATYV